MPRLFPGLVSTKTGTWASIPISAAVLISDTITIDSTAENMVIEGVLRSVLASTACTLSLILSVNGIDLPTWTYNIPSGTGPAILMREIFLPNNITAGLSGTVVPIQFRASVNSGAITPNASNLVTMSVYGMGT